MTSELSLH